MDKIRAVSLEHTLAKNPIIAVYDTESNPSQQTLCLLSEYWNGWNFDVDYLTFEHFAKLNDKGLPATLDTNRADYTYGIFALCSAFDAHMALDMLLHIAVDKPRWDDGKRMGFLNVFDDILNPRTIFSDYKRIYTSEELKNYIKNKFAEKISKAKPYRGEI